MTARTHLATHPQYTCVFKAHRLLYHSTLGSRVIKKKKSGRAPDVRRQASALNTMHRCRANIAHIRKSWPDSGLSFQVKVLKTFKVVPSSLRGGIAEMGAARNSRTLGQEVRNLKKSIFAFCAILRVVDSIFGISVMPKIA